MAAVSKFSETEKDRLKELNAKFLRDEKAVSKNAKRTGVSQILCSSTLSNCLGQCKRTGILQHRVQKGKRAACTGKVSVQDHSFFNV
jgi:hypothetical protein